MGDSDGMEFDFTGPLVEWRGPAPYFFVRIPDDDSDDVKEAARGLEYWGQVAVRVRIGEVEFDTALFPKDGGYLLPLKAAVRREVERATGVLLNVGDPLAVGMDLRRDR